MAFTRQNVPTLDRTKYAPASGLEKGAYILAELGGGTPDLILMASGSEVGLIVAAGQQLAAQSVKVRLVSFPSWELFAAQSLEYRQSVLPATIPARLAVEAGVTMGWERWVGDKGAVLGINRYGASAPAETVFRELGLTAANVVARALSLLH
jgi:transketolase